jgi:hypothetical protein
VRNFGPVARRQSVEAFEVAPSLRAARAAPLGYGLTLVFPANAALRQYADVAALTEAFATGQEQCGAASASWTVDAMEQGPSGARVVCALRSTDHPELATPEAPDFLIRLSTEMRGGLLIRDVRVANLGDAPLPLALGFLTHLRVPRVGDRPSPRDVVREVNGQVVVTNPENDFQVSLIPDEAFSGVAVVPGPSAGVYCVGLWTLRQVDGYRTVPAAIVEPGKEWHGALRVRLHERGVPLEEELERRGKVILRTATLSPA